MLSFREHDWMPVPGLTRFTACIQPDDRSADDLRWSLDLHYLARGPQWRRVTETKRPRLYLSVSCFQPCARRWTDLERVNFWELADDKEFHTPNGLLCVAYTSGPGGESEGSSLNDHIWRVAGREGRFLTVELAAFADGHTLGEQLRVGPVLPDGTEDTEAAADFWKENAQLYLIEQVPFGLVTVQVPRNTHDKEAYALGRARTLLGLGLPDDIELEDYSRNLDSAPHITGDVFVYLHYHGYYRD